MGILIVVDRAGTLGPAEAALNKLLAMELETIPPTPKLHRHALIWTSRLEQNKGDDGHYLALAEQLDAVFWSADRRLVNRVRQSVNPT